MPQYFPLVSQVLLDRLNEIFPDGLPKRSMNHDQTYDIRSVDWAVGARMVIDRLQLEHDRQNNTGRFETPPRARSPFELQQ
jgi:hypothetical protein